MPRPGYYSTKSAFYDIKDGANGVKVVGNNKWTPVYKLAPSNANVFVFGGIPQDLGGFSGIDEVGLLESLGMYDLVRWDTDDRGMLLELQVDLILGKTKVRVYTFEGLPNPSIIAKKERSDAWRAEIAHQRTEAALLPPSNSTINLGSMSKEEISRFLTS